MANFPFFSKHQFCSELARAMSAEAPRPPNPSSDGVRLTPIAKRRFQVVITLEASPPLTVSACFVLELRTTRTNCGPAYFGRTDGRRCTGFPRDTHPGEMDEHAC
jgi:hypothetical protein